MGELITTSVRVKMGSAKSSTVFGRTPARVWRVSTPIRRPVEFNLEHVTQMGRRMALTNTPVSLPWPLQPGDFVNYTPGAERQASADWWYAFLRVVANIGSVLVVIAAFRLHRAGADHRARLVPDHGTGDLPLPDLLERQVVAVDVDVRQIH